MMQVLKLFIPYPLQSFAQRYLGLNYTQALNGLFPYWLKEIYRASSDKEIFYRYFREILGVDTIIYSFWDVGYCIF